MSLNGDRDAFATKLNPAGSALAYSSYLGGSGDRVGRRRRARRRRGRVYRREHPLPGLPHHLRGLRHELQRRRYDAFVTKLNFGPPPSTPRCKVTGGGGITAANGDRATFSGSARSDAAGNVTGQQQYRDHGPAQPQSVRSIRILALTCNQAGTQATIIGEATLDGTGTHAFQIDVQDLGNPGKVVDTYRIVLDTGYDSGVRALAGDNVQIRRKL